MKFMPTHRRQDARRDRHRDLPQRLRRGRRLGEDRLGRARATRPARSRAACTPRRWPAACPARLSRPARSPCAGCCSSSGSIVFVDTLFFAALTPLLPHYADELGLGKAGAGVLAAAYPAGALFGAIPSGIVAARFGVKPTVLVGMSCVALTTALFGFADEAWQLDLARFSAGARELVLVDGRARVARRRGAAGRSAAR